MGDSVLAVQRQGDDWSRAHEHRQAGERQFPVVLRVEIAALLGAQLQLPPLVKMSNIHGQMAMNTIIWIGKLKVYTSKTFLALVALK